MFPKVILNKSENRCTPILVRTVLDSCYGRAARRVYIPRRNAAKREKEGRGGAGQGGGRGGKRNSIWARTREFALRCYRLRRDDECARTTTRSFLRRPVLGNNLHRLFVPLSALSRNKERISFFPPFVWGEKRKGERKGREGRGERFFQRRRRRRPWLHFSIDVDVCPCRRRLTVLGQLSISLGNEHRENEGWEEGR